jgi:hypothetical protein
MTSRNARSSPAIRMASRAAPQRARSASTRDLRPWHSRRGRLATPAAAPVRWPRMGTPPVAPIFFGTSVVARVRAVMAENLYLFC